MHATLHEPGTMALEPGHVNSGRTLVYVDDAEEPRALVLWLTPEVAAQWVEALTPLAEQAKP